MSLQLHFVDEKRGICYKRAATVKMSYIAGLLWRTRSLNLNDDDDDIHHPENERIH